MNGIMPDFAGWYNFYIIMGSAAGALIGLQFVVMTLIAERPPKHAAEAGSAFSSPTVVHFGAVLFLSAVISIPWKTMSVIAAIWAIVGLGGVIYMSIVGYRIGRQTTIKPDFEDWLFYFVMPLIAYVLLALSAFMVPVNAHWAMFSIGTMSLLLLFIGIHNAWDNVAYHVLVSKKH